MDKSVAQKYVYVLLHFKQVKKSKKQKCYIQRTHWLIFQGAGRYLQWSPASLSKNTYYKAYMYVDTK